MKKLFIQNTLHTVIIFFWHTVYTHIYFFISPLYQPIACSVEGPSRLLNVSGHSLWSKIKSWNVSWRFRWKWKKIVLNNNTVLLSRYSKTIVIIQYTSIYWYWNFSNSLYSYSIRGIINKVTVKIKMCACNSISMRNYFIYVCV